MRRLAVLAMISAACLSAADFSGMWIGSATGGRRNQIQDFAFQFVQNGTTLTGKLYQDYTSAPIIKGTIEGDQITFQVLAKEQSGNEINTAMLKFTGTLKDGEIEISKEREEIRNAGNAGAGFVRPQKQTFKLKRLM
jgi:hypothetical protein